MAEPWLPRGRCCARRPSAAGGCGVLCRGRLGDMNFGYEMFDGGWKIGTSQKKKIVVCSPGAFLLFDPPPGKNIGWDALAV